MKKLIFLLVIMGAFFGGINAKATTVDELVTELEKENFLYMNLFGDIQDFSIDSDEDSLTVNFKIASSDELVPHTISLNYEGNVISYERPYSVNDYNSAFMANLDTFFLVETLSTIAKIQGYTLEDINNIDFEYPYTFADNGLEMVVDNYSVSSGGVNMSGEVIKSYRIDVDKTKLVINESPLLLSVSYVTSNSVTLSFDSRDSGDDICKLYRSTDKISYGYLADVPCDGTYTDSNLSPNTTYYYKFDKGEIDSDVVSVTTLDYVESGDDNINEDVDDENNTDSEINVDTEADIDDEIENPSTGVFIPIILLLVLLGLGLLLFYYTKKKNIFNKI